METKAQQTIKYTTDGKKVVVLGNLNSQEKIVQEIFIVDGSEIPSGEHFVVKSLHDAPAVSWKETRLKEIEEQYNNTYKKRELEYEKMCGAFDLKMEVIKEKLSFLRKLDTSLKEEQLERLIDFISGDVKYIVVDSYGSLEICEYDETITTREYGRFDSIKLLSIFGKTDGNLSYGINTYNDGSGSYKQVYPCKTMEQALSILKEQFFIKIEKNGVNDMLYKTAEIYNIEIPESRMVEYKEKKRKEIFQNIESYTRVVEGYKQDLLKYE